MATPAPAPQQVIVFICNGVHTNPPTDTTKHVAQNAQEVHDETVKHGCQFWQVLVPPK